MKRFKQMSISNKLVLIILSVSLLVVTLVGGAHLAWDSQQARQALAQNLSAVARLLGNSANTALAFNNTYLGKKNLAVLQKLPHVMQACLYRNDTSLLAEYRRHNITSHCPVTSKKAGTRTRFEADYLHVAVAIQQNTQPLGWTYLRSDLSPIKSRLQNQATFSALALLATFLFAWLLALWLQRLISNPIKTITKVARAIEKKGHHHLRAPVNNNDELGQLAHSFNTMLDALETRNQQLIAAKSEQQVTSALYRNLVESTSIIPWELDLISWNFTYVGHQAEKILGYPITDWYKENFWFDHLHPDDREANITFCRPLSTEVQNHQLEYRVLAANGRYVWLREDAQVIRDANKPVLLRGFMLDITERKRSEEAIKNIAAGVSAETGEAFFRHLVEHLAKTFDAEHAFIGMLDKNNAETINTLAVYAHGHIVDNISYPLKGSPCTTVIGQKTCAYPSGVHQKFPEDALLVEMNANGYIATPLFDKKGGAQGILVVLDSKPLQHIEHISDLLEIFAARTSAELERMKTEEALQESEQQQRDLLNNTSSVIYMKDLEGRYLFINRMFENLLQISNAEARGKTDYEIFPKKTADNFRNNDLKVIKTGALIELEETVPQNDGEHVYMSVKFPLKKASGEIYASCGISTDITERKLVEEALRRSQKMDAIGQLSGGIAHDFNNQLGVIIGYLDFLQNYVANDEKPRKWVNTASRATMRCIALTRQLLTFSRKQNEEKTAVNLNTMLNELKTIIQRSVTPEVNVQYFLADDLWQTEINSGECHDAILNLVINARDAMPGGGKLLLETSNKSLDASYVALNPGVKAGDYVQLMLGDNGSGMDKKTLEHIFEPFFTTKPEGKGTGLGMAMVYGFTKRYGGHIKIYSELNMGTTVHIYLPRSTAPEYVPVLDNDPKTQLQGGNESILIVDDEVHLLRLANQYLSDLGYRTRMAEGTEQALKILAEDEKFDMLFSDVVMPGDIGGYELARQATQQQAGIKVLLTSGFTSKVIDSNLARFSAHLLNKPYRKVELAQRVRLVLDEK